MHGQTGSSDVCPNLRAFVGDATDYRMNTDIDGKTRH